MKNWKTTAAGILSALLGMSGPATAFIGALQAMKPTPDYRLTVWGIALTAVFGTARIWVGLLQNDAPAQPNGAGAQAGGVAGNLPRGTFIKLALAAIALPAAMLTSGCSSQSYLQILVNAVSSILTYIPGPLASQISAILTQISADISTWKSGTLPQTIAELLTDLRGLLDSIPLGKLIDSLVSIAIGAIEALLGATAPSALAAHVMTTRAHPVATVPLKTAHQFAGVWNQARKVAGLPASVDVKDGLL